MESTLLANSHKNDYIIISMFASIKSVFQRTRSKSNCENVIRINFTGGEFIALIGRYAILTYGAEHIFLRRYLMPFINPKNSQLER